MDVDEVVLTTAVKALNEDCSRVGGYLVLYGSPQEKDLQGEYFHKGTDLELGKVRRLPGLYHHGKDATMGYAGIGVVDTLTPDEFGVWAEMQLDKSRKYHAAVQKLVREGVLHWSSGAIPEKVVRGPNGRLDVWPLREGSLTPTPAEFRGTNVHMISEKAIIRACKMLDIDLSEVGLVEADREIGLQEPADDVETVKTGDEGFEMTPEEMKALAEAVGVSVKAALAVPAPAPVVPVVEPVVPPPAVKSLPVPQPVPAGRIEVTRATKYSGLKAQDMAFLHQILSASADWQGSTEFYRELADKSIKAVEKGELGWDAVEGLMGAVKAVSLSDAATKANELMGVGQSGFGAEWAPDSWRSEIWARTRQENVIAPLFDMIDMPTNPYELPIESTDATVSFVPETSDQAQQALTSGNPIPQSRVASNKVQMSAKKLALRLAWSAELNEDSIIPIVARARGQSLRALQNAIDNVLFNGDTDGTINTNINSIDGTPAATDKYMAFNGLRKYGLITNTAQKKDAAGSPTMTLLRQTRFLLAGAYALRPRDLAWIVDDSTYAKLLNLPEFATMDKAGPYATNLSGQVGVVDGIPVFATGEMGLANTAGKVATGTPANNTTGTAVCVFRPNWMVGYRRQVQAVVEYLSWGDFYHLTVTARLCLVSHAVDTKAMSILFDITV